LLYQLSYPANAGAGLEPATHGSQSEVSVIYNAVLCAIC